MPCPHNLEMALRNIIALGLQCCPDNIQKEEIKNFCVLGKWGDPAGYANADSLSEKSNDLERTLIHKYIVGYFILTLINIWEHCEECLETLNKLLNEKEFETEEFKTTNDVINKLKSYLKQLDDLKSGNDILILWEDIIKNFAFGKNHQLLNCFRNCLCKQ